MNVRQFFSFWLVVFFALAGSKLALAKEEWGVGVILGNPTGLNGQFQLSRSESIDFQLGYTSSSIHFNLGYLFWSFRWFNAEGVVFDGYYGGGLRYYHRNRRDEDDMTEIGFRVPLGIAHRVRTVPVTFFGEISPTMNLVEETSFLVDLGIGVRYNF